MTTQTLVRGSDAGRWDQAIYAFLAEKERRSGSIRTVQGYSRMLYRFFRILGKSPDEVTATEVFGYAHGTGVSGKKELRQAMRAPMVTEEGFFPDTPVPWA